MPPHLPPPALRRTVRALARRELLPLLLLLLMAGAAWCFVEVADEVEEGEAHGADTALLLALREPGAPADPRGPRWLEEAARDVTALGSLVVLAGLTLAVAGFLALAGKRHVALLVTVAVAGGQLLNHLLKTGFDRPRPDLVPHAAQVFSSSFPSGHAMTAAATYLTLGALVARVQERRRVRVYLLAVAVAVTILVGVSRVYLGVHWPSDVLAGWAAGAAWAALCWLAALWLQRRGQVEPPGAEPAPADT
jgi:undecaprenyl-diphosphatase